MPGRSFTLFSACGGVSFNPTIAVQIVVPVQKVALKTTIDISDSLLRRARRLAAREGVTLRTLVERGLHHVVAESRGGRPFKLRRASFKGTGLQSEFRDAKWDRLREAVYKNRGA
jgi:hypothetical protein